MWGVCAVVGEWAPEGGCGMCFDGRSEILICLVIIFSVSVCVLS